MTWYCLPQNSILLFFRPPSLNLICWLNLCERNLSKNDRRSSVISGTQLSEEGHVQFSADKEQSLINKLSHHKYSTYQIANKVAQNRK